MKTYMPHSESFPLVSARSLFAAGVAGWLVPMVAILVTAAPCGAQVEDWKPAPGADRLVIDDRGVTAWKANCDNVSSGRTYIKLASMESSSSSFEYNESECIPRNEIRGGIALRRGGGICIVNGAGEVNLTPSRLVLGQSPDPSRISAYGQIVMSSPGYLFWTDEEGEFFDGGRLWRAAFGGSPVLVADHTSSPRASFRRLMAVDDSRVIALRTDDVLANYKLVPGLPPSNVPFWLSSTIATNVSAACMRNGTLYWVSFSGTTATFHSAPVADTSNPTNLGYQTIVASQHIYELAHGDGRLWYPINTYGATITSELRRRSATVSSAAESVVNLPYEIKQLCANDRYVCWIKNANFISRLPVGSAAITRNLTIERPSDAPSGAPYLEIVQSVQNATNGANLVADKVTHVRAYARIAASSSGETSLMPSPPIVLHGSHDGIALPGSPLSPGLFLRPPPPLSPVQGARSEADAGYWFRLPESWTKGGTHKFWAEVNPAHTISETNFADNVSPEQSAAFWQKVPVGMKMIPTVTHFGTILRESPAYRSLFDQIEVLLATSELRFEFCHDLLDEEHTAWEHSPFEFRPGDDDALKVLWGLGWKKVFGSGGRLAEPGGYDHYVAMLPEAAKEGVPYSGISWAGDEVSITVSQSLFFENPNIQEFGMRFDAMTQAHELSHNYGLLHLDTGGAAGPYALFYPYPGGIMSTAAAGYQGYNPFNHRLIHGDEAWDLMGYIHPKWVSNYTWGRQFDRISTGFGPSLARAPMQATSLSTVQRLVGGFIDMNTGTAEMRPTWLMGSAEGTRAANSLPLLDDRFVLRAWKGSTLISTFPVRAAIGTDGPPQSDENLGWFALPDDLAGVNRLELAKKSGGTLGQVFGGGAAPAVNVIKPLPGTVITAPTFEIHWSSSDDGNAPLAHMVRYSHDNGATWHLLTMNYGGSSFVVNTADVPGSKNCRVEVSASDGIFSTSALSGEFTVSNKPPEVALYFENGRGKICASLATATVDCGEPLALHADASDIEDGWLSESAVAWSIFGPVARSGSGRLWRPEGLPPGTYTVTLVATDSDGAQGVASSTLIVRPAYVENSKDPLVLDGFASDNGYTADRIAKPLRYSTGDLAEVRMVHREGQMFIAVSGLLPGAYEEQRFVIGFDLDNSGGAPGAGDLLVAVHPYGAVHIFHGNGSGWVVEPDAIDITGVVGGDPTRWSVEIAIPDARFTAWDGRTVRAFIAHLDRDVIGDNTAWAGGTLFNLSTWTNVVLGPDPEDPTDSDGDGMPDWWERAMFGGLSHNEFTDTDGDGQTDAAEFISGTDPRSGSASFRAIPSPTLGKLSWNSAPGRSYTVWRSPDLRSWMPIATGIGADVGASTTWIDPAPPADKAFFKVEAHYCR